MRERESPKKRDEKRREGREGGEEKGRKDLSLT